MNIPIYTTSWCPDCRQAKRFLEEHQLPYEEFDIQTDLRAASPTSALGGVKWFIYNELVFYSVTMWTSPPSFGGALSPPREF